VSLDQPFARRIKGIEVFARIHPFRVLELTRPADLEIVVRRLLARMADDQADDHAWVYASTAFEGYRSFFQGIVDAVAADLGRAEAELTDLGLVAPTAPDLRAADDDEALWAREAADYLAAAVEVLPSEGSLVIVLEPGDGADRLPLGWSIGALAWYQRSSRVKLIVVGPDPLVPFDGGVEDKVVRMNFAVPAEELESEVRTALAGGGLDPAEARRYRLLAGALATAGGRFEEGEALLKETVADARAAEEPGEEANGLYNLGNLYSRAGRHGEAAEVLTRAAAVAIAGENDGLAAMALTNLGIALYHEGRGAEAVESLAAARRLFRALNHRPGEAHAVDCTAQVWAPSDPDRARALWQEALELYDSIEAPHLEEVRRSGRADVLAKVGRLSAQGGVA